MSVLLMEYGKKFFSWQCPSLEKAVAIAFMFK